MEKSFAVVKINNAQYTVREGDTLDIQKIEGKEGDSLTFDDVLLKVDDGKVQVGKPTVAKASIKAEIVAQTKGEKIDTLIYKAKSRYKRLRGHRQLLTKIKINKIS